MKKMIATVLIVTIFCLSVFCVSAESLHSQEINIHEKETFTVVSLDVKTRKLSHKKYDTLETTETKNNGITQLSTPASFGVYSDNNTTSRKIFGDDIREKITNPQNTYPYKAVCQLLSHFDRDGDGRAEEVHYGTAFMEGASIAVTNGHMVYDAKAKLWCEYVEVIPARSEDNESPFGVIEAKVINCNEYWMEEGEQTQDWAVIELETAIGKQTGWFGKMWTSGTLNNTSVNVTGYPKDKPNNTMWRSPGTIEHTYDEYVKHTCDTYKGNSGSPIYNNSNQVVAIHSNAPEYALYNRGVRITEGLYNYLNSFNPAGPGSLDSVTSSRIAGWAVNDNNYMADCEVHLYIRKASDNSYVRGISGVMANQYVSSSVGFRGFSYPINWVAYAPMQYKIEAFAIYGSNPALANSPRYFTVRPSTGVVDVVTGSQIAGWAWKPDAPDESIRVHIYIKRADSSTATAYSISSANYRSDLERLGYDNGNHGFIHEMNWSDLPKEVLTVEVYAVDGSGHNPRIYVGTYNNTN